MKARATTYNGVPMRSRLEAGFAAWLDWRGVRWDYEPRCFASERGQWLPDFLLHDVADVSERNRGACWFVEVKSDEATAMEATQRVAVAFASDPRARLLLAWPGGLARVARDVDSGAGVAFHASWLRVVDVPGLGLGVGVSALPPWSGEWWKG